MRHCLLAIALLLGASVTAQAQVLQTFAARADDVVVAYPSPLSSGTHVVLAVHLNSKTNTLDLQDLTTSVTTLLGPVDHTTENLRGYILCYPSEAGDTDVMAHTSASAAAMVVGMEIFGGSCNQDGAGAYSENSNQAHDVASPTVTTKTGSFVVGAVASSTVSNFSVDTGTSIQAAGAAVGDDILGGNNVGVGLGQYFIAGAPGSQPVRFDSASNEFALVMMAAVKTAEAVGGLMMMNIGGSN